MREITATDARERLSELLDDMLRNYEPVVVTRHGRPIAMIMPWEGESGLAEGLRQASEEGE